MGETAPRAETTNPTGRDGLCPDGPVDPAEIRYRPGIRREGAFTVQYVTIHGYRRAYVKAGSGPALLLIHGIGAQMLVDLGVTTMRLMTNNPVKYGGLEGFGLDITERVQLETSANPENIAYLRTKRERMGHLLHGLDDVL